jgi:HK97 family phage prohead protease
MTDTDTDDTAAETPPDPGREVMYRTAETVGVRWADRVIEVIAVPWDQPTPVMHRNKQIVESFAKGAFGNVAGRPNAVKVYRDHPIPGLPYPSRPVGRARTLHPNRDEGLVAELGIPETILGDETLELANEGVLDASVGFWVKPGGDEWLENRSHRRIIGAGLDHIALVPDPAYAGARVLAVRAARTDPVAAVAAVATPNLDRWRLEQLCRQYGVSLPE